MRSERFRYIRYDDGSEELYDLDKDAHEWINLASVPEHEKLLKRFRSQVDECWPRVDEIRPKVDRVQPRVYRIQSKDDRIRPMVDGIRLEVDEFQPRLGGI